MKLGAVPRNRTMLPMRAGRALAVCLAALSVAAAAAPHAVAPSPSHLAAAAEDSTSWQSLSPAQREALQPLQQEWPRMDALSKRKWLALAARFPGMPPAERARIQTRMADWAKLTPKQRGKARLHYQEARALPRGEREAKWQAYQALSAEQKKQLALRASGRHRNPESSVAPGGKPRAGRALPDAAPARSTLLSEPELSLLPESVAPTLLQARPGATTISVAERPGPRGLEPAGMPKIAASPDSIDPATLLPRRGPQAVAPAPDSAPH